MTSLAAPLHGPVSLNLPFAPTSAGDVRRALIGWLDHHGSPQYAIDDAVLVVTELIANAIRHASPLSNGTLLVGWRRAGTELVLSVTDGGGPVAPRRIYAAPEDESGRGLAIVGALAVSWQVGTSPAKREVLVRLSLR